MTPKSKHKLVKPARAEVAKADESAKQARPYIFLFDYDNTLYDPKCGLVDEVVRRMILFLQEKFGWSPEQAAAEAERYRKEYGTITTGLFKEHKELDLDDFSHFVHDFPVPDYLQPDHRLQTMLAKLKVPLYVLSNGWEEYVEEGLRLLGVRAQFRTVFGIRFAQFIGKPNIMTYERAIDEIGVEPCQVTYFDDNRRDLAAAKTLGMTTVWVHAANDPLPDWVDYRLDNIYQIEKIPASPKG